MAVRLYFLVLFPVGEVDDVGFGAGRTRSHDLGGGWAALSLLWCRAAGLLLFEMLSERGC